MTAPHSPPGLRPNRRLGQNFLVDANIARNIAEAAGLAADDPVVEIGPGLGSLTRWLLQKVHRLHAIERDPALAAWLQAQSLGPGQLQVVCADALRIDYLRLAAELGGPLRFVANLPYCISSPLLFHLIDQRSAIRDMLFMLQKEVVDRLVAPPGGKDYGALTVQCRLWMEARALMTVPPTAFRPQPQVTSAVVHLVMRDSPVVAVGDPDLFKQIVRAAFGQRRKILANALRAIHPEPIPWLRSVDIDPQRRGETLSMEEFARLANIVGVWGGSSPPAG